MNEVGSETSRASRIRVIPFNEGEERATEHMVGQWRPETPRPYFSAPVIREALDYLKGDRINERGGVFTGTIHRAPGRVSQIEVTRFVPETQSLGTPTRINVTAAKSEAIQTAAYEADLGQGDVVGWIHSHPGMRPAPSEIDENAMSTLATFPPTNTGEFFTMVYDPETNQCGVFRSKDGRVVNQGGFAVLGDSDALTLAGNLSLTPYNSLHSNEISASGRQSSISSGKIRITKEQIEQRRLRESSFWNRFKTFLKKVLSE